MENTKKSVLLAVLAVVVMGMTVAYALLSTSLQIGGSVSVPDATWDVHIEDFARTSNVANTSGSGATNGATVSNPTISATSISNLGITLNKPRDKVEYIFKIVNDGTINAKLSSYTSGLTCAAGKDCSNITYSLTCTNSMTTQNTVLIAETGVANCTLSAELAPATVSGANQTYTQTSTSGTINAEWVFVQE